MNTFAIGSLPVHFSVAKLFTFRWQYTLDPSTREAVLQELFSSEGMNLTVNRMPVAANVEGFRELHRSLGFP